MSEALRIEITGRRGAGKSHLGRELVAILTERGYRIDHEVDTGALDDGTGDGRVVIDCSRDAE